MRLVRVAVNVEQLLYRPPGGIGRYTAKLVTLLPRLFPDDRVVPFTSRHARSEIDAAWREAGGGAEHAARPAGPAPRRVVRGLEHLRLAPPRLAAPALAGVDLVHAPSVAVPPRGRAPLVVTVHDVAPALFPEAFPAHGRWFHARGLAAAARRATLVITVSHAARGDRGPQHHLPGPAAGRAQWCRPRRYVDPGAGHGNGRPLPAWAGRPYILWVGTLEPRKNVATLVEAFASLVESGAGRRPPAGAGRPLGVAGGRPGPRAGPGPPGGTGRSPPAARTGRPRRTCGPSMPGPPSSPCPAGTRASGCRCSRPWPRARPWCAPTSPPSASSPAPVKGSCPALGARRETTVPPDWCPPTTPRPGRPPWPA